MAKGDVIELENGQRVIQTADGFRPLKQAGVGESLAVGMGSVGDRGLQAVQELMGTITPEEAQARAADRESMKLALGETNPISNFVGRNIDEIPGMLGGSRIAQAVIGGIQGGMQPADTLQQRIANVGLGAGLSVVGDVGGQVIGSAAGRVLGAIDGASGGVMSRMVGRAGNAVDEGLKSLTEKANKYGLELSPGMLTGNPTLQRYDVALSRNPLTAGAFDSIKEKNGLIVNRMAAEAAGIPASMLEASGGKITPAALQAADQGLGESYEALGAAIPEIKLPDGLRDAVLGNRDIKKLVAGSENLFNRLETDGVISGQEYAKLRSALMKTAANETNSDVAAMVANQATRLDQVVDASLPDGLPVDFPRIREQWRNLELLQRPGVLAPDGSVRPGMLKNRLQGSYGTTYTQELFDRVQPETGALIDIAKTVSSPQMLPIVGTSGTAEGIIGDRVTEEMSNAVLARDPGAIAQLLAKQKLGDFYMEQGRKNPDVLIGLLQSPGNFVSELNRAAGRTAASEQGERP